MSIMTEQHFRVVPKSMGRALGMAITIARVKAGTWVVSVSRSGVQALGRPTHVQVLLSGTHIAIRACAATDQHARRVNTAGGVSMAELGALFGIETGERYRMEAVLDEGHLVAELPGELAERTRES